MVRVDEGELAASGVQGMCHLCKYRLLCFFCIEIRLGDEVWTIYAASNTEVRPEEAVKSHPGDW